MWLTISLVAALLTGLGAGIGLVWREQRAQYYREKAHVADALRESEERYRTLVASLGEGIGQVNLDEIFVFANPAAESMFGVPPGGLVGRNLRDFVSEQEFERIREQTSKRKVGEKSVYEVEICRGDGEKRLLLVTAAPQFDGGGGFLGTFGVFRDITEQRQAEAEIKTLSGLLPICSCCKNIRDDKGYWNQIEVYIQHHSAAKFTHGMCPKCIKQYYPGLNQG
jgi:PAS domain S-box-containing protein